MRRLLLPLPPPAAYRAHSLLFSLLLLHLIFWCRIKGPNKSAPPPPPPASRAPSLLLLLLLLHVIFWAVLKDRIKGRRWWRVIASPKERDIGTTDEQENEEEFLCAGSKELFGSSFRGMPDQ